MTANRDVVNQVQNALNVEIIPGTEIMADVGELHLKHSKAGNHRVLVPQPSDDPKDPLNWNRTWKGFTMAGMAISSFANGFGPLSKAPQVPYYIKEWGITLPQAINTIGICILVLGFSNFIWVPIGRSFGRRPMLLFSMAIGIASSIWSACATSYSSFIGACVLQGIAAGPGETAGPMLIADVIFLHDRGLYMGVYMWAYWSGLMLGPVIAGVITEKHGWRSFWWCNTAICTFSLIYQIFFLPETKWNRRIDDTAALQATITTNKTQAQVLGSQLEAQDTNEKASAEVMETKSSPSATPQSEQDGTIASCSGRPTKAQFLPWSAFDKSERIIDALWLPFRIMTFPIIQWSSFVFSWCASCFLVANVTQSQALAGPPWNLSAAAVGYTNFAIFVGTSIALLTAGPLSDWISMRATLKNGGIREPEMRLPALIPFTCCTLIGSVIIAVGYQYGWKWEIIVVIGYTLLGIQVAAVAAIATTYAVDSYKPITGEFLVSATINKNLWGYGVSQFLNTWIIKSGYITPIMVNMGLCLFFISLGIPLFFWGKTVRRWSANSSVHKR